MMRNRLVFGILLGIWFGLASSLTEAGERPKLDSPLNTDEACISLWHFDERQGDIAKDETGKNDLVVVGEGVWTDKGIFGSALDLNGIDRYAYYDKPIERGLGDIKGALTIEAWVKIRGVGTIVGRCGEGDTRAYFLNIIEHPATKKAHLCFWISSDGTARLWDGKSGYKQVVGNTPLSDGLWYHLAAVFEPGLSMRVYVNGTLDEMEEDVPDSIYSGPALFSIGMSRKENFFNGLIDEVRISNVARYE